MTTAGNGPPPPGFITPIGIDGRKTWGAVDAPGISGAGDAHPRSSEQIDKHANERFTIDTLPDELDAERPFKCFRSRGRG